MATYNGHFEDANGNILLPIGSGLAAIVETSSYASQAYTKGTFLFFNNKLCRTLSAISSGTQLVIGTNIAYTTLGAELKDHFTASNGTVFTFQDYLDGNYD